ncbi:DUF599 domain-containing protein [Thalassotalea eurytherma]|uniref:Membrane protein n=1 Tax=Thalassotalea eurytherma TaxID=1144278 RepID=A0ABQ6H1U0_9GAMM|nr:DUF599 domain-containing protein [Thalassotalea eurytherma]GLX81065.1 membrane protein [Thalassotalea eurytherma]
MMLSLIDIVAAIFFVTCWYGYTTFARKKAKTTNCIAHCLHQHRIHWMHELIGHDVRVSDASLLANLERNIAFFASSTLLVLAGLLTLFAKVGPVETVINSLPYASIATESLIQIKISLLVCIFVLAFFNFTWSMRQYGFLNVMVGAMPLDEERQNENLKRYARQMAIVQDQAAHSYNYGLRAYYFSLAALCWLYHPFLFMFASGFVVYTLYIREFQSKAVRAITVGQEILNQERDIEIKKQ